MTPNEKQVVQMGPDIAQIRAAAEKAASKGSPSRPKLVDPTLPGTPLVEVPMAAPNLPGVGSAFAANQAVSGGKQGLSDATIQGMSQMAERQAARQREEQQQEARRKEQEAMEKAESEASEEVKTLSAYGTADYSPLAEAVENNPYLHPDFRKHVEAQMEEINLTDAMMGRVKVRVTLPNGVVVLMQSIKAREMDLVSQVMKQHLNETVRFYEDRRLEYQLALGIEEIGTFKLPALEDEKGKLSEKTLEARHQVIADCNVQFVGMMAIVYVWFDLRIRRALTATNIKNG